MNAKKIMGAVLVALLAAALFVGAGAAADMKYSETVFVNEKLAAWVGEATWTDSTGANVIPLKDADNSGDVYFPKAGVYTTTIPREIDSQLVSIEWTITVVSPEVVITGVAGSATTAYEFIPGTFYIGSTDVAVTILSGSKNIEASYANMSVFLTLPDGSNSPITAADLPGVQNYIAGLLSDTTNEPAVGEYTITVVYNANLFVTGTTIDKMSAKPVTFKVAEAGDVTIASSVDKILKGQSVKLTITGQPGVTYQVNYDAEDFKDIVEGQIGLVGAGATDVMTDGVVDGFKFTMPNTGKVEVVIFSTEKAEDTEKITVVELDNGEKTNNDASVTIALGKGTITAKTDAASYFVGDVVKISGTSTAGDLDKTLFKLTGTNFINENLDETGIVTKYKKAGDAWSFELDTSKIKNEKVESKDKMMDVGSYTLTLDTGSAKATVVIVLKQPFISIIEAPEVIVKGEKAEFIVNAEAANEIQWYLFGTNFFNASKPLNTKVDDTTNQFKFELNDAFTKTMDEGQYFMVIQHPMYDEKFNINATGTTIQLIDGNEKTPLFNVFDRQTANAAQALCDALDTQNIDDMYVKYSFFVVGEDESFTLSEIPTTIAQGETLTISGVSTANAGEYVTVEMISTAFAAVPKETVGSAAFIAVTTQIADDGTWEVTFDTSDLNVDEYSLKVACSAEDKPWKNVNINVVEAADEPVTPPTDEPGQDEPGQDEPVAPETPGFGALAALAGLGAVAVLLLRRE